MRRPTIYFAGVNTSPLCEAFIGLPVLESFADIRKVTGPYRALFDPVALDCGAFTVKTQGKTIDIYKYIQFCLSRKGFYRFVASLDVIGGSSDENIRNWETMQAAGVNCMPTWHSDEAISVLKDYCTKSARVGIGIVRPLNKMPPRAEVKKTLDAAFAAIPATTKVHGWGLTNYTDYPFDSVDSTTWMREFLDLRHYKGQGASVLRHLTNRELLELVQKKYERQGRRDAGEGL